MDIITRIKNRLFANEKNAERFEGRGVSNYRTVFRFDAWKLFKGHSGHISVTNRTICFETQIFGYRIHQWINNTGNMSLHIRHQLWLPPAKWLSNKLTEFEKNLTKNSVYKGYPRFICKFEEYTFCLDHHSHITFVEEYPSFKKLYNHGQMITMKAKLYKRARKALNIIKNMSDEEFFAQVLAYNLDAKPDNTGFQGIIEYKLPSSLLD